MLMETETPATILVIFGITGDLSQRYLLNALSEIKKAGHLPKEFRIVGISRRSVGVEETLRSYADELRDLTEIFQMDLGSLDDYHRLKAHLEETASRMKQTPQVIFDIVVPPDSVPGIIKMLGEASLNGEDTKLLLEKPFGTDLESAKELIENTTKYFKEGQTYRIDHYLAKETAQNIVIFISSNALFRRVWNKDFIEFIEIVAAEEIGVEGRAGFYEQTGALRDFVQSHLLQLAALILMEPYPEHFDFSELPRRRALALKQMKISEESVGSTTVRAQYSGYREEVDQPESLTETFVAIKLVSDDPRWEGVPVYLATGKRLDQKLTQIRINFRRTNASEANILVIRIQPREGIELDLWVKKPGYERRLEKKTLSFSYEQTFADRLADAYEKVLVDAINSDQSLFASNDEVIASWQILQPVLDFWKNSNQLKMYKAGSTIADILDRE
jgi:glucose-6-phosphate 1-dehydrogenase